MKALQLQSNMIYPIQWKPIKISMERNHKDLYCEIGINLVEIVIIIICGLNLKLEMRN